MEVKLCRKSGNQCKMTRRRRKLSHRVHHAYLNRRRRNFHTMQMFVAVSECNVPMVKSLIKQGVRINARDDYDRSLLHVNAINGNCHITRRLLQAGCYVNSINCVGDTPLHEAISHHNIKIASQLIRYGANVRVKNGNGDTPLHFAVVNLSHVQLAKEIIRNGARINSPNIYGMSAFHFAVEAKNVEIVRYLISLDVVVNSKNCKVSALHMAAGANSLTLVNMLLNAGADVNHRDVNDCTPIQCAVYTGNLEMVKTFLKAGANIDNQNKIGATALHNAIMCNNEEIILLLLSRGASVNVKTQDGDTPLHWASMLNTRSSHVTILKKLLDCGSDVNDRNERGQTPFHFLVQDGDTNSVSLFMKYKADIERTDFEGGTALHYAIYNGDKDVLNLVMDNGVAINQTCNSGLTALHHASKQFRPEYIRQLIARGAEVNAKDIHGRTPLYFSLTEPYRVYQVDRPNIAEERRQVMKLLLDAGSDLNLKFYPPEQPKAILDVAIQRRDMEACIMIIQHAAKVEARTNKPLFDYNYLAIINQDIKRHYEKCRAELTAMRKTKIDGTLITYLNVLMEPLDVVSRYARNRELVKAFETSNYRAAYPVFRSQLKAKLSAGVVRQKQMEKVARILSTTLRFADPSNVCFEIIFKYFSKAEVEFLIDAAFVEDQRST